MKACSLVCFVVALFSLLATSVMAGPRFSQWKGKISFDSSQLPNPNDPNQQALIAAGTTAEQQTKLKLTLRGDHTYTLVTLVSGSQETTTGTWSQSGAAVTIQPIVNGQPGIARTFIALNKGHKLAYTQGPMTITFNR